MKRANIIQENSAGKNSDFSFFEAVERITSFLSERSRDILFLRYGLLGGEPETLEGIGKKYGITRERVRQIIREMIKKIKSSANDDFLKEIFGKINLAIEENSGIIRADELLGNLGKGNPRETNSVILLLDCIGKFELKEIEGKMAKSFISPGFELRDWENVINEAGSILKRKGEVQSIDSLHKSLTKSKISSENFLHYLSASLEIKKNIFGKWGLTEWSDVSPRVTWQRAYVILRETKQPLHFTEIAKLIDDHKLGKRKTHPQTVHNELIKNENFVLVGRGTYALSEWGYKKGTVKEVLEDILAKNEVPMKKDEILARVMQVRQVKKSTIIINLNNFFNRVDRDKYTVKK